MVASYYLYTIKPINHSLNLKHMTTQQGCTVDFSKKATASFLTQLSNNGQGKRRYYVDLTGNYYSYQEFMETYIEFEAIDWDGSKITISELDIIQ